MVVKCLCLRREIQSQRMVAEQSQIVKPYIITTRISTCGALNPKTRAHLKRGMSRAMGLIVNSSADFSYR